jgi:acyl-CoA synthetase (AMP-forming)/AMP-acid ligase II
MVIRSGENAYPREIEEFLYTHPDIQDIQVIGVPAEIRRGALRLDRSEARRSP